MLDAFVIERIHLRIKRTAEAIKNTLDYECSVLCRSLMDHQQSIPTTSPIGTDRLLGRCVLLPDSTSVHIADGAIVQGSHYAVGDFALKKLSGSACEIVALLEEAGEIFAAKKPRRRIRRVCPNSTFNCFIGHRELCLATDLSEATAWYDHVTDQGEEGVVVLEQ